MTNRNKGDKLVRRMYAYLEEEKYHAFRSKLFEDRVTITGWLDEKIKDYLKDPTV